MFDATVRLGLEQHTSSPGRARHAVQQLLGDEATIEFTRDAILLTSELVTNAVLHTDAGCHLKASYDRPQHSLRVEVDDTSPELPVALPVMPNRVGGRGLHLVGKIASRWGATSRLGGKTTWFELDAY